MTLELLISTIDEGIWQVQKHLPAPCDDVRYLISWQYTGAQPAIPIELESRQDVRVIQLTGRGLCRNRNHALKHACGDILKICDDDEKWQPAYFQAILDTYRSHPEYDVVHFQALGPKKVYPPHFVSSFEITLLRQTAGDLRFDERFGLGSPCLNAGEETVFIYDARQRGLTVHYEPKVICETDPDTTGDHIQNPLLQRSKGAVFYRTGGLLYAVCKSIREAAGWMLRRGMNPFSMLRNMFWGIHYIRTWQA